MQRGAALVQGARRVDGHRLRRHQRGRQAVGALRKQRRHVGSLARVHLSHLLQQRAAAVGGQPSQAVAGGLEAIQESLQLVAARVEGIVQLRQARARRQPARQAQVVVQPHAQALRRCGGDGVWGG